MNSYRTGSPLSGTGAGESATCSVHLGLGPKSGQGVDVGVSEHCDNGDSENGRKSVETKVEMKLWAQCPISVAHATIPVVDTVAVLV